MPRHAKTRKETAPEAEPSLLFTPDSIGTSLPGSLRQPESRELYELLASASHLGAVAVTGCADYGDVLGKAGGNVKRRVYERFCAKGFALVMQSEASPQSPTRPTPDQAIS